MATIFTVDNYTPKSMKSQVKLNIQQNIPLAPYTTFKIGGPAKYFAEVSDEEALIEAIGYAKDNNLEFFILGGGSNILVSDKGFDGLVIKLQITSYELPASPAGGIGTNLKCGAGLSLSEAVKVSAENSLSGLEWAAGIPGTVGGAIRGNAGAFGSDMVQIINNVDVLEIPNPKSQISNKLQIQNYNLQKCNFSYRNSIFKQNNNLIIKSAILNLKKGNKEKIESKIKENLEKRSKTQPTGFSAGSFFKNPVCKDESLRKQFETDTGQKCKDDKIPAGWLISEAGFLGKKVGNIQVSEKHGNFVINPGGGKAEEVIILASMIKQKVREKFNVQLSEEVQYVGF
jgi:UDP-N-acetylmuramate dehydrogenase